MAKVYAVFYSIENDQGYHQEWLNDPLAYRFKNTALMVAKNYYIRLKSYMKTVNDSNRVFYYEDEDGYEIHRGGETYTYYVKELEVKE